jgi:hypothetical protein
MVGKKDELILERIQDVRHKLNDLEKSIDNLGVQTMWSLWHVVLIIMFSVLLSIGFIVIDNLYLE